MNKEIKAKWVAALRSGEYQQGIMKLRDRRDHFCCLGVLCNIHAQAHPTVASTEWDPDRYLGQNECLPVSVAKWARVNESHQNRLAMMNDGERGYHRHTFKEIADYIEAKL
jgi:hypothetical protein